MVLAAAWLNTQHSKVRIKGKVEQSWEWSSTLPNKCAEYDTKQSDDGARVMLELWGIWSTPLLPLLCFDLLTRPKMPFKVVHRKEVTHPGCWKSEEVAQALRLVYITAWELEGNIRPTNWGQWEIGEKEGKQYSGRRR